MRRGPLIILSGPSGSGKSTVIDRLLSDEVLPLRLSISATTRPRRPNEKDGVHYHFWTRERFQEVLRAHGFLESAEVHGNLYGTPREEVDPFRDRGTGVVLDIDVQGARNVRAVCPNALSIFLETPSWEDYERRLRQRGTEDDDAIARRLATAHRELESVHEYDYRIVNDRLEDAVSQVRRLIAARFA